MDRVGEGGKEKEVFSNPEKVCRAEACQALGMRLILSRDNN